MPSSSALAAPGSDGAFALRVPILALTLSLGATALAAEPVRIVAPDSRTVAIGKTAVEVEGPADLAYRVYRRDVPGEKGTLICNLSRPPRGTACVFDAGRDLASEQILVEAVDRAGNVVDRHEIETYFFQQPEVSISRPTNPVVEVGMSGAEDEIRALLDDPTGFGCSLDGYACRVRSVRKSRDAGLLRIAILIDESNSIGREGLAQLLPAVRDFVGMVDVASEGALAVEYEVLFFSESVRSATFGFTGDLEVVEAALAGGSPSGGTCLYQAASRVLRDLEFWKAKDRWSRRDATYALVVWSDGQDACPDGNLFGGAPPTIGGMGPPMAATGVVTPKLEGEEAPDDDRSGAKPPPTAGIAPYVSAGSAEAAAAIDDARWSEVPIYVVPIPLAPPCAPMGCLPDPEYLELGTVSGGESYDPTAPLFQLLTTEIFDDLMSRWLFEIEPESLLALAEPRTLELEAPAPVELRYREIVGERRPRRETALELLRAKITDIEAKAAAADLLAKDAQPVTSREAERIYRELVDFIDDLGRDLEAQAREAGRDELARALRTRRRESRNRLTSRELTIVQLLEPRFRRTFMASRNAMLEAIVTATGRALLWDEDRRRHRRFVDLLEKMTGDGYWLANPDGRLAIYLRAYLDPERGGDPELRGRVAALLAAERS